MRLAIPWLLLAASVALNVFFFAGYWVAQLEREAPAAEAALGEPRPLQALAKRMNLTPDQTQRLVELAQRLGERRARLSEEGRALNDAFWDELARPRPRREQIEELIRQANRVQFRFQRQAMVDVAAFLREVNVRQRRAFVAALRGRGTFPFPAGG